MPKTIDITIVWDDWAHGSSLYSMGRDEIENIIHNYGLSKTQANIFSYIPVKTIRQWISDVFARDPHEIVIERVIF